jgi:MurNAc alpha-1-phosphate uridylyltransferase
MLQTIILAGGLGTRISSVSDGLPKSLIKIKNRTFLSWQLELLRKNGVDDLILCLSHKADMIEKYLYEEKFFGMNITISRDGENQIGTGGAIINALPLLNSSFMVIYGDSYLPISFMEISNFFEKQKQPSLMTVTKHSKNNELKNVLVKDGIIFAYNKSNPSPDMNYIDYGLNFFSKRIFENYSMHEKVDLSQIQMSLALQNQLAAFEVTEPYYEIGSVQGIIEFEESVGNLQ